MNNLFSFLLLGMLATSSMFAGNQTPTVSTILPEESLPFTVTIEEANFNLLAGVHSFASAMYGDKWLIIGGRTNGMHGFSMGPDNFPPDSQNRVAYVVDPDNAFVAARFLTDSSSGLSLAEIDSLSVTSPCCYQTEETLYIVGGYGIDNETNEFVTMNALSAIDIKGMMDWVMNISSHHTAKDYLRQTFHEEFQVTGGALAQMDDNPTLLVFGQNFDGHYVPSSSGIYTEQVRRFWIHDDGKKLSVDFKSSKPAIGDPDYRRRDLNVIPIMKHENGKTVPALVALSGVFTLNGGIWTVPVDITGDGYPSMQDPDDSDTFKQGMNNYASAFCGLYSHEDAKMYTMLFGGISFGYFDNGEFETDPEIPFINQVTTIKRSRHGHYSQYLMDASYPTIISTGANPGNTLLFGAGASFFPRDKHAKYSNGVFKLDHLKKGSHTLGYIAGGIQSTVPNTSGPSDSSASSYVFKVIVHVK